LFPYGSTSARLTPIYSENGYAVDVKLFLTRYSSISLFNWVLCDWVNIIFQFNLYGFIIIDKHRFADGETRREGEGQGKMERR
jgi:hypothetical protein